MNDLRLLLQADANRKIINLQFKQISNLQLMMPILSKFQHLESLSLNGNRLQNLPDLSPLNKLTQLDISNNLFRDIEDILSALKSLPQLTHLMYSFKNNEEENLLLKELPKLERLNKRPLNNAVIVQKKKPTKKTHEHKLYEKDLEEIAVIYDDIRQVYKKSKYFVDKELAEEFDKGVDLIMGELSTKLTASESDQERQYSLLASRYALVDLCFVKMITFFYHFDKNIASIMERIHDYIAQSFKNMSELQKESADRTKEEIANVTVKKEELFKKEIKRLKDRQESHLNEITQLESKNAQLLEKITKNSKANVLQTSLNAVIKRKNKTPLKGIRTNEEGELNIKLNKSLTLNQLKETIGEIYFSKNKHNAICASSGIPMQTLETHMYTFLNQKYGLKPMTVEWAMSIVNGIKKYSQEDAEVAAFGKMLRNQLEEDFIQVIKRVKLTIRQANRKFKGDEVSLVSMLQSEQILLIAGFKREAIELILSRAKKQNIQQGHISPAYLQHLTLQYTLRRHCQKIRRMNELFKEADSDEDGVLTQDQMIEMLEKVKVNPDVDVDQLLQLIDPFNTNVITYSFLMDSLQKIPNFKQAFGQIA